MSLPELKKHQVTKQIDAVADMQALVPALFAASTQEAKDKSSHFPEPDTFFDGQPSRRDIAKFWIASMKACIELLEREMA